MTTTGFKTSATCNLCVTQSGRQTVERTQMVDISSDGAHVLCSTPLAVGSTHTLAIDGFQMPELPVQVVANYGDAGNGYRLALRLTGSSWPYQVYSTLSSLPMTGGDQSTATPPCLKELNLEFGCSVEDIEKAFSRRVRIVHPDRGGEIEAFVRVRSAYLEAMDLIGGKR